MARIAKIFYKRITLSLPERVVVKLRKKVGRGGMSNYVAEIVEKDLDRKLADESKDFVEDLKKFCRTNPLRTNKDSLTLLREIRYGK